jgi:hypothetical protein
VSVDKRLVRFARLVHDGPRNSPDRTPPLWAPESLWATVHHQVQLATTARARRWTTAEAYVTSRLVDQLIALECDLRTLREQLKRPVRTPAPFDHGAFRQITDALRALEREFTDVEWDLRELTVSVTTAPITLRHRGAEVSFGRFRISLHVVLHEYVVHAVDPVYGGGSDYFHPHVSTSGKLCEGRGSDLIAMCLEQRMLFEFFVNVRSILETYNPESPYLRLSAWGGGDACDDCSDDDVEETITCEVRGCSRVSCTDCYSCVSTCADCENDFCPAHLDECTHCEVSQCGECSVHCQTCDGPACHRCQRTCDACNEVHCRACVYTCRSCEQRSCGSCGDENTARCADCLVPAEETTPESEQTNDDTTTDAAVQPDRVCETDLST